MDVEMFLSGNVPDDNAGGKVRDPALAERRYI
jgi:hypothetical protein